MDKKALHKRPISLNYEHYVIFPMGGLYCIIWLDLFWPPPWNTKAPVLTNLPVNNSHKPRRLHNQMQFMSQFYQYTT